MTKIDIQTCFARDLYQPEQISLALRAMDFFEITGLFLCEPPRDVERIRIPIIGGPLDGGFMTLSRMPESGKVYPQRRFIAECPDGIVSYVLARFEDGGLRYIVPGLAGDE